MKGFVYLAFMLYAIASGIWRPWRHPTHRDRMFFQSLKGWWVTAGIVLVLLLALDFVP